MFLIDAIKLNVKKKLALTTIIHKQVSENNIYFVNNQQRNKI